MNIYYKKRQKIDIGSFWRQILRMMCAPVLVVAGFIFALHYLTVDSWPKLLIGISFFSLIYLPSLYYFSLNEYEKGLFSSMIKRVVRR